MTTCMGKSCSFGLLCVSEWAFVKFCVYPSFPFGFEGRMWDVIVLIPGHCLSFYFERWKYDKKCVRIGMAALKAGCVNRRFFVKHASGKRDMVIKISVRCMCVRPPVRICPGHNFFIYARISK